MATVSNDSLRKVERFFIEQAKLNGTNRIEATVADIASGSGIALATSHKGIKELEKRGLLKIIKPSSRRFPITYIYTGDIEDFKVADHKEAQIEYLQEQLEKSNQYILELEKRVRNLESTNQLQRV